MGLTTLTPCGGHTDQGLIPLIGCVSLCGGVMPVFFQKWKNAWSQLAHGANINYTEPTNQESNLIKLIVPHPLENLYTLSFGFSPQRGLKVWHPRGTFGAACREKWIFQWVSADTQTPAVNWLSFECADDIAGSIYPAMRNSMGAVFLVPKLSVALKRRVKVGNCLEIMARLHSPSLFEWVPICLYLENPPLIGQTPASRQPPLLRTIIARLHSPSLFEWVPTCLYLENPPLIGQTPASRKPPLLQTIIARLHSPSLFEWVPICLYLENPPLIGQTPASRQPPLLRTTFIQSLASSTIIYKKSRFWPRVSCLDFTLDSRLSVSSGWGRVYISKWLFPIFRFFTIFSKSF